MRSRACFNRGQLGKQKVLDNNKGYTITANDVDFCRAKKVHFFIIFFVLGIRGQLGTVGQY